MASLAKDATEDPSVGEQVRAFVAPSALILLGIYYFIQTWIRHPLLLFTDFEAFKHKSFSKFWNQFGGIMSEDMPPGTAEVLRSASGVVLDVGPGSGFQLHNFDPSKITKIYAVEPAVDLHKALLENAQKTGFKEGQLEIVSAGAEPQSLYPALAKRGLMGASYKGSQPIFDTISCCRVLCGVPNHTETIETLYRLLKPGGKIVVCEHVINPYPNGGSQAARFMQRIYMLLGWWFWMGGCCLDRDTYNILQGVARQDGGWKSFEIRQINQWSTLPHVVGVAVKN